MVKDATNGSLLCPHGGKFYPSQVTKATDPNGDLTYNSSPVTVLYPCPGVPSAGIPPCQFASIIGTSTKARDGASSQPCVLFTDLQISSSNGFPATTTAVTQKAVAYG